MTEKEPTQDDSDKMSQERILKHSKSNVDFSGKTLEMTALSSRTK